ncbi:MAG: tetratricopeptide repeat protein [Janthinobacterium lividum]
MALTNYSLNFRWLAWAGLLLGLVLLAGCASSTGVVGHAVNNVAARDNAYFLAREQLRATETKLYAGRVNDYNQRLPLFPTLDSASVRANRADLNGIIKRASMPIQNRPGSDWTDDAYLLVAWARFYSMQFDDASLTFKYVNSTSKDPNAQHEGLIGLMRTFVVTNQLESAKAVSDLLDREVGLPTDARELFLTRADYYLRTEEPKLAIPQLEKAVPLIEIKNERSRTRYLLAQLYQEQGDDKKAVEQLNDILAHNPPYELDFFSKLLLAQVSGLDAENKARLDKYFAGLLKDPKNKEYRDKIYYEMARLAYRQKDYSGALAQLRTSAKASTVNRSQKSYTYLLAGRIYYENLQKYRLAAAYYDSTVQNMDRTARAYVAVKERADVLKEFAKQYTIVETQDSLQALVRLAPGALDQRLDQYADAELAARQAALAKKVLADKVQARAAELAGRPSLSNSSSLSNLPSGQSAVDPLAFDPTAAGTGAQWYFDNPATLGTARADFLRKWDNRRLQDNWRTTSQANSANPVANGSVPITVTGNSDTRVNPTTGAPDGPRVAPAVDPAAEKRDLMVQYRQALPTTPEKLQVSNKQIEAALYELGNIYKEQLKERDRGIATYAQQVQRFPQGPNAPDAYYLLYLHYKALPDAAKAAGYAAALQREFPQSLYAKLIADPQYREHELALHKAVASRVDSAFVLYKNQEFRKASAVLTRTERQYPKNDLSDRLAYLKTLLVVRTQAPLTARGMVEKFYKDFPDSPLVAEARALANTYQKQDAGQITGALASTDKPVVSMFRPGEIDNRLRVYYSNDESPAAAVTPAPATSAPVVPAVAPLAAPAAGAPKRLSKPTTPTSGPLENLPKSTTPNTPATATPLVVPGAAPASAAPSPASAGLPTAPAAPNTAATSEPAVPTTAYGTQLSAAHAVVLVFPKGTPPVANLDAALDTYNHRWFRDVNLQVQAEALDDKQDLLVVRALTGAKVAQSYAVKLRGPQSPLGRLRGQGFQVVVISLENLALLQSSGDLAGYQAFFQKVYK